jgi:hypothetical protein
MGEPMTLPPLLQLDHVTVQRSEATLLSDVSLTIPRGRHTAILGPNGSGKTSLMRLLSRHYYPSVNQDGSQGTVKILGRDDWHILELRRRMGIISASSDRDFVSVRSGRMTAREVVSPEGGRRTAGDVSPRKTNELNWKPSGRHKFANLLSPAGLWDQNPSYPSAYADGSSSTALWANAERPDGSTFGFQFQTTAPSNGGNSVGIDDFSLIATTAIPEPTLWVWNLAFLLAFPVRRVQQRYWT